MVLWYGIYGILVLQIYDVSTGGKPQGTLLYWSYTGLLYMSTPVCYESVQQPAAKKGKGCEENTPVAPEKKKTPAKTKKSMAKGKTPANKPQQVPTKEKTPAKKTPKSVTKPAAHRAALTKVQKEALDQLPHFLEVLQGVVALAGYQHPEVTHPAPPRDADPEPPLRA